MSMNKICKAELIIFKDGDQLIKFKNKYGDC